MILLYIILFFLYDSKLYSFALTPIIFPIIFLFNTISFCLFIITTKSLFKEISFTNIFSLLSTNSAISLSCKALDKIFSVSFANFF